MERGIAPSQKTSVTWVLVADDKQSQVYIRRRYAVKRASTSGNAEYHNTESYDYELAPVPGMALIAESLRNYLTLDKQVYLMSKIAGSMYNMDDIRKNIEESIKHRFIGDIAKMLNDAGGKKLFGRLVLIAPAEVLEKLKAYFDKDVLKLVAAELPQNLTYCDNRTLVSRLRHCL